MVDTVLITLLHNVELLVSSNRPYTSHFATNGCTASVLLLFTAVDLVVPAKAVLFALTVTIAVIWVPKRNKLQMRHQINQAIIIIGYGPEGDESISVW